MDSDYSSADTHRDPFREGAKSKEVMRAADAAQYARPSIPEGQRGQIRVRLLNATPDPLGSVAALCEQYKGNVIRSLSEVTDEQRRACLDDMASTVLNGPLEAVQLHWQIEGVTRSITHQMVRSRASFFAQESLRFAVPEGEWAEEIPMPPSISRLNPTDPARRAWKRAMSNAEAEYANLIAYGVPAEEARGVLPHDMPTRIHWVMDLRTLLAEAGKRTCTQAQFPWRMIFAGMAKELRSWGARIDDQQGDMGWEHTDGWQFAEIANRLRPVCFQTGRCGFMAKFDRSCSIRERVETLGDAKIPPADWNSPERLDLQLRALHEEVDDGKPYPAGMADTMLIRDYEWAADPSAARS